MLFSEKKVLLNVSDKVVLNADQTDRSQSEHMKKNYRAEIERKEKY